MAYSVDFRKKILAAYLGKEGTNEEIAHRFKISISTVKRIGQRYRETGKVELHLSKIGHSSKVDEVAQQALKKIIKEKPGATLKEICQALKKRCQLTVTLPTIHYVLKKLALSYKKKSVYASQRDSDEVKKKRSIFGRNKRKTH
jgi:transposase